MRRSSATAVAAVAAAWTILLAGAVQAAELIMYELAGCPYCRQWLAEVGPGYPNSPQGRIAPLRRHLKDGTPLVGVALASPITAIPTFVLVEDGKEVGRITGFIGPEFFYPMMDELIARLPPPAFEGTKASPPQTGNERQ